MILHIQNFEIRHSGFQNIFHNEHASSPLHPPHPPSSRSPPCPPPLPPPPPSPATSTPTHPHRPQMPPPPRHHLPQIPIPPAPMPLSACFPAVRSSAQIHPLPTTRAVFEQQDARAPGSAVSRRAPGWRRKRIGCGVEQMAQKDYRTVP